MLSFAVATVWPKAQYCLSMGASADLAARRASAPSARAMQGTYWTTLMGLARPAAAAALRTMPTACAVKSGGHMFETTRPSAISPASCSALSPRAAMSSGMSGRGGT